VLFEFFVVRKELGCEPSYWMGQNDAQKTRK